MKVGNDVKLAAENVGAAVQVRAAVDPVKLPRTQLAPKVAAPVPPLASATTPVIPDAGTPEAGSAREVCAYNPLGTSKAMNKAKNRFFKLVHHRKEYASSGSCGAGSLDRKVSNVTSTDNRYSLLSYVTRNAWHNKGAYRLIGRY